MRRRCRYLPLAAGLLCWAVPIVAFGPIQVVSDDTMAGDTPQPVTKPRIAIDARDVLHVVFAADVIESSPKDQVFYTRRHAAGGAWLDPNLRVLPVPLPSIGHPWLTPHGGDVVVAWPHHRPHPETAIWAARYGERERRFDEPTRVLPPDAFTSPGIVRLLPAGDGHLVMLWENAIPGVGCRLALVISVDGGHTWAPIELPWPPMDPDTRDMGTCTDGAGRLYVTYVSDDDRLVLWVSGDGGYTWPEGPVVLSRDEEIYGPDVAVAPGGTVGVAWAQSVDGVAVLRFVQLRERNGHLARGDIVTVSEQFPHTNHSYPDLEVDAWRKWHIACRANPGWTYIMDVFYTSSRDGLTWEPRQRVNADPGHARSVPAMAIDSEGYAHVVYAWGESWIDRKEIRYATNRPFEIGTPEVSGPPAFHVTSLTNPASASVVFELQAGAVPRIIVFDVGGRAVRSLLPRRAGGAWHVAWDLRDLAGRRVQNGLYVVEITTGHAREARKLVVVD